MKWLFARVQRFERPFSPNYWVDGSQIKGWEQKNYLPGRSLVDTPFQLIKAGDFYRQTAERILYKPAIKEVAREWVKDIDELDTRGAYAFPRYDDTRRNHYLTDHVLIWQAIKSAKYLGVEIQMEKDYSPQCVQ